MTDMTSCYDNAWAMHILVLQITMTAADEKNFIKRVLINYDVKNADAFASSVCCVWTVDSCQMLLRVL